MSPDDGQVREALAHDRVIDITTVGRSSLQPRRIETWFHRVEGRIYLTGLPGKRDWYANLLADPVFTFHLKESVSADLPARAIPITDLEDRRAILSSIVRALDRASELDAWVTGSPLVEVRFDELGQRRTVDQRQSRSSRS